MGSLDLRFRQIHLDFHTSPDIEDVGIDFNPDEFAETLVKAGVNSITCFARCHHGMLYYDSKLNPERVHPHLANKNLLREQIEACHKRGIRVPIYITVQWDHFTAQQHPEWLSLTQDGMVNGTLAGKAQKPYEPGFYHMLCVNSPYRDFLKAHTKELLDMFDPADGLFFDIVSPVDCSCSYCRQGMTEEGMQPHSREDRLRYAQKMIDGFQQDMTAFIRRFNKACSIFYNKGHIGTAHRPVAAAYSHFELESLPSGYWGYLHFPITMRYARNLGLDCLGMTGKFHTMWGDFHSFKNKAALEFECFNMLALNAKCMTGDQLEPGGRLSGPVYELIGSVYSQIEKKEKWCSFAKSVTEIGVLTPEEFAGGSATVLAASLQGAVRMLQESAQQFDILDSMYDFSRYKLLILPDNIPVSAELALKIERYLKEGGSVIASFESGMNSEKNGFSLKALGVRLKDEAAKDIYGNPVRGVVYERADYADYLLPKGDIGRGLPQTEHVMYIKGMEVEAGQDSEVLAEAILPCFNRTYRQFCSHRQAPSSGKAGYDGIVRKGNAIYFAHPIFSQYHQNAPRWCKQLIVNAIEMLIGKPFLIHSGPSTVFATVNEQLREDRWVIHLLHYIPERRSKDIDIIEDVIPLYNVRISVKAERAVTGVTYEPQGKKLDFCVKDGRAEFIVPEINGHQMAVIHF